MDENILTNDNPSPIFTDTTPEKKLPYKRKKTLPSGAKIALIIVAAILVLAILGGVAMGAVIFCFGMAIGLIVVLTMPENDGTFEYEVYGDEIEIVGLVDMDYSGVLEIPAYIDGKAVTSICNFAFYGCTEIHEVYIPDTVKTIGYGAFEYCYSLSVVELGNSLETIEDWAFMNCESLVSITLPDTVTSICYGAFEYCYSLESVEMGDNVTYIGEYAFSSCDKLKSIELSSSLEEIGDSAFRGCSALCEITIPESVTYIGPKAFYNDSNLAAVNFENNTDNWSLYLPNDEIYNEDIIIFAHELTPENAAHYLTKQYAQYVWYQLIQTEY